MLNVAIRFVSRFWRYINLYVCMMVLATISLTVSSNPSAIFAFNIQLKPAYQPAFHTDAAEPIRK